jgi:pimeloyl-ACP methyl ester carboxylesterase
MKFVFILLMGFSSLASAETCGHEGWGWNSYKWCAFGNSASSTVIYYFHGNGESERGWETAEHATLVRYLPEQPMVIAISLGKTWFLDDGLRSRFVDSIIPHLETKLAIKPNSRVLFGESMGGFNALQVYFKSPGVFNKVVALCPAVPGTSPYATSEQVELFLRQNPAVHRKLFTKWRDKLLSCFSTPSRWEAHDPNQMALNLALTSTPLLLHAGDKDPLGFFPRTLQLKKQLRSRRANVSWLPIVGGSHCTQSPTSLRAIAGFIAN